MVSVPVPIDALGSYLFNCQRKSTLSRSPLIRIGRRSMGRQPRCTSMQTATPRLTKISVAISRTTGVNTSNAVEALRGTSATGLMEKFCELAAMAIILKDEKGSVDGDVRGDGALHTPPLLPVQLRPPARLGVPVLWLPPGNAGTGKSADVSIISIAGSYSHRI